MQHEVEKLQLFLKEFPDTEVWIVARNKEQATVCWEIINSHIKHNKKPTFPTAKTIHGLSSKKAVILFCGHWYANRISSTTALKSHITEARLVISIGELMRK